jgi:hypothetical protein
MEKNSPHRRQLDMKISKFKEVDSREGSIHKSNVEAKLSEIKTEEQAQNSTLQTISDDQKTIKQAISGLRPRTERTKIINQTIDEDFIILETTDDLFDPPVSCKDIFDTSSNMSEVNQFFLLEEDIHSSHCSQRKYNFDTDNKYAFRLDQYSGDSNGYFDADGQLENESSDVLLTNDTLYKLKLRLDENATSVPLEDGFSATFHDLEKDNILSFKRDHTISGYMVRYVVEGKANS